MTNYDMMKAYAGQASAMQNSVGQAGQGIELPALQNFESQLNQIIGDFHRIRQSVQGIRARAYADIPEGDPPSPAEKAKPVPNGALGRIAEQLGELRSLEGIISDHVARLGAII